MKYILLMFLCVDGCVCSILGMGPGLVSMSPLRSSKRCSDNVLFCISFSPLMCFVRLCLVFFVRAKFIMWFEYIVCILCCLLSV